MSKEIVLILCANLLVLCGCSKAQQSLSNSKPEIDLGASQQPTWTPTVKAPSTSTHTSSPTSTIIPTHTFTPEPTVTAIPSLTSTPTNLPPILIWRNWYGLLKYETSEWIDKYDSFSLYHRHIDGCSIEVIAGRGLPAGWKPLFDRQTIGALTWDRVRWTHNGVLKLTSLRIPDMDEMGYSVWGGSSVYACTRAAEAVLETYQPNE